jgi:pyruvate carboxylase
MSGLTSQPPMGAVCASLEQTGLGTGIRYADIQALNLYWSQVRMLYTCFEANVRASDSSVFDHEMPGGQYTNLMFQASQLGLGTQWTEIKRKYIEANQLCGNIIKVTPSSKVVGDFAQWMTQNKVSAQDVLDRAEEFDFPSSVVEFFQGYLGQPVGGFPEPLRSKIIRNKARIEGRPGANMEPLDFKKIKAELRSKFGKHITDNDVMSYVMYPKVSKQRFPATLRFGNEMGSFVGLRGVPRLPREVWRPQRLAYPLLPWPPPDRRRDAHLDRAGQDAHHPSHGDRSCC